jgi:uncharacterized protein YyaL (SSP411 family)
MSEHQGPTNRLAAESSPYLLLHRHNPVDWYPWGAEAIERARREDKPIFLSVGYSTCYWCHVMERESFSDPRIAALMNREFVNVKLDREERPDLDEIYMAATQILSGQGGWPNSLFLTPELKPYYAGTYFPPDERYGRPGFGSVLADLAAAWRERRPEVEEQAAEMARAMGRFLEERSRPAADLAPPEAAGAALASLARRFDREWGGFGGAPKFPTPSNLFLLLEMAREEAVAGRRGEAGGNGDTGRDREAGRDGQDGEAGSMLAATLDQMARGGIYDQLGGGFHRYATDREWKVPHFEKMLYDNGLLLELYAREHARTGDRQAARVARETAEFLRREMTAPEGALWSAVDAETHGHEGSFYVWSRAEIEGVLGAEDAAFLAPLLGFAGPPFFEGDRYVLHLPEPLELAAERRRLPPAELRGEVAALGARLLAARARRERPATDDKVLADWNGMAIAGLAVAGSLLAAPELTAAAARAADFMLGEMRPAGGPLLHAWRGGRGKIAAYLADYAYAARALLALHEATGEPRWLAAAAELTDEQGGRLADPEGGFFVAAASPDLLFRSKDPFDGAVPSANAVAALNLVELARRTGDRRWLEQARITLQAFASLLEMHPDAARMMAVANLRYHRLAEEWGAGTDRGAAGTGAGSAAGTGTGAGTGAGAGAAPETGAAMGPGTAAGTGAGTAAGSAAETGAAVSFGPGAASGAAPETSTISPPASRAPSSPLSPLVALEREAAGLVELHLHLGEPVGGAGEGAAGTRRRGEKPGAGEWRRFRLVLEIAPGWHIQAHEPADPSLNPTELAAVPTAAAGAGPSPDWTELRRLIYPPAKLLADASRAEGEPAGLAAAGAQAEPAEPSAPPLAAVYAGRVEITGELRAAAQGGRLRLVYQACDEARCLPRVELEIPVG